MREIKFRTWNGGKIDYSPPVWENNWLNDNFVVDGEDPYIYMQYTGLHDKNGKEIYEGDITKSTQWEDEPREVVFWEGCFCHKKEDGNGHIFNPKHVEIIGNIYENPELLNH